MKLIEEVFGQKISADTLWSFYKTHQIAFRTGKAVYRTAVNNQPELLQKRIDFAKFLANALCASKDFGVIFQDETTFNSFTIKKCSWSSRQDEPLLHHRNDSRISTTVFGAIGNKMKAPCFKFGRSTNKIEFMEYLHDIHKACKKSTKK